RLVRRGRGTEIAQGHSAVVSQTMRLSGWNENAVARFNALRLAAHGHQPTALKDEVDLLWPMAMKALFAARLNHGKGCGQMLGAAGPRRGQQVRSDPFRTNVPGRCLSLEDVHEFLQGHSRSRSLLRDSGVGTSDAVELGDRPLVPHVARVQRR